MSQKTKRTFSAEFKPEAAKAINVDLSTMDRWVRQLKNEREGILSKASLITPEQIEISALKKGIKRINLENGILKKTSELLMWMRGKINFNSRLPELCLDGPMSHI